MKTPFVTYVRSFFTKGRKGYRKVQDRRLFLIWLTTAALAGYAIGFTSGYVL